MRWLLGVAALLSGAQTFAQPAKLPCEGAEFRQFDFWVGEWDVYPTGKPDQVATSLIEKLHGGCVIRENWRPAKGTSGTSLNMYDPRDGKWRQLWADAGGSWVEFEGRVTGEAMVLTGTWRNLLGPNKDGLIRMTYTKGADGSVRQLGVQSTDEGKSWTPSFDFTYRPRKG